MCGIAGFLNFEKKDQSINPEQVLSNMLDSIRHRGPDDRGYELISNKNGPTLHLGHQRFSIIDLSPRGHQPMANENKTLWISTNSEIYNFRELREELSPNFHFNSQSDTEVLLKAYEHWGLSCLEIFRGMFAFAIWDAKIQSLILVRDRLGIKPLYYLPLKNKFLFASEVRALLASGLSDTKINHSGLYHFLSFGHLKSPNTLIGNIQELQPGHYLVIDSNGNMERKRYWNPNKPILSKNIDQKDPKTYIDELLKEAVQYRQVSDVPIGAFLSGGIDSSAIVGHMNNTLSEPITTISIGFKERDFDESEYSAQISNLYKTKHKLITLDDEELLKTLPDAINAMDQPTIDGINTYIISLAAKEAGLKVVLSGLGGDELFGGYPSFRLVSQLQQKKKLLNFFPNFLIKFGTNLLKNAMPSDQSVKLEHLLEGKLSGAHEYFLIRALYCENQVIDLFADQDITKKEILNNFELTNKLLNNLKINGNFTLVSYLEMTHYLQNMLLRDTDMMSMSLPLEVRVPFMDHKLVEYMFSLPEKYKKLTNTPKSLLVDSLKTPLPDSIVNRKKMGFTLPFELWMRGKLKSEIESVLLTPIKQFNDLISQPAVENIWKQFLDEKTSWSRPWALYVLKRWVDKNLN